MGRPTHRASLSGRLSDNYVQSKPKQEELHPKSKWYSSFQNLLVHFPKLIKHLPQEYSSCKPSSTLFYRFPESDISPLKNLVLIASSFRSSVVLFFWSIMTFPVPSHLSSPPLASNSAGSIRNRSSLIVPFLKCIALCFVSILVLVTVLGSSRHLDSTYHVYKSYRRLQEGALQMFSNEAGYNIGNPSLKNVKGCPDGMEDYVPCYDVTASIKAGFTGGEVFDRHCDLSKLKKECIIRAPKGYRLPMKWPACSDNVWSGNIRVTKRETETHLKRILVEENLIRFSLEKSSKEVYVGQLEAMIAAGSNKSFNEMGVRLVLDVGSGLAAFSSDLLSKHLLTMSISTYEAHGGAVQFALERGLPAMIGSFSSRQLPYPASSYDVIHCSSCEVEWHQRDGLFLYEANRLLRPGGFFIWTFSSSNQSDESILKNMKEFTSKICWSQLVQRDLTIIWQKTSKQRCHSSRASTMCEEGKYGVDEVWYEPVKQCITKIPKRRWRPVQQQHVWPNRLMLSSRRLSRYGIILKDSLEDVHTWSSKLTNYWSLLSPIIFSDHPKRPGDEDPLPPPNIVRNVMDMNAQYGGFNAALLAAEKSVWVMNVVPTSAPNTLPIVYDRGLLGAVHDWCEAFPAYPRTYDLLYATSLLSQELKRPNACGMSSILLEMDRLLRPEGWVLLQDEMQVIEAARTLLIQMRWEARIVEISGQSDQRLLVGQKNWRK